MGTDRLAFDLPQLFTGHVTLENYFNLCVSVFPTQAMYADKLSLVPPKCPLPASWVPFEFTLMILPKYS